MADMVQYQVIDRYDVQPAAEQRGIIFQYPDRASFAARLAPMKQEFAERAGLAGLIARIEQA